MRYTVSASTAHDYLVFDYERGAGGAVVLVPISIGDVPKQVARTGIKAKQMCMVRVHVDVRMPHCHTTIDVP